MELAEFLFPRELQRRDSGLRRVLVIGSCLSEIYVKHFAARAPNLTTDFVLYNNAEELPADPPRPIQTYDVQYLQIPLRSVLTDVYIQMHRLNADGFALQMLTNAKGFLDLFLERGLAYNKTSGVLSFVANFIVPQGRAAPSLADNHTPKDIAYVVEALNAHLTARVRKYRNVYVADVNAVACSLGKRYFLDDTISFYSHGSLIFPDWADHENAPHWTKPEPGRIEPVPHLSTISELRYHEFLDAIFRQIESLYRVCRQIDPVKLVIFDLDNVMWRGNIGDHYLPGNTWPYSDGWPLGIWETVHHLRSRGIAVSLCSKNEQALVESRWPDAVNPPFVALADFLVPRINWQSKAENVGAILGDLSLTAASAVFVDDNPAERALVEEAFPGIRTIGSNPFVVRRILLWSAETQVAHLTNESVRREDTLKQRVARETAKAELTRDQFIERLQTHVQLTLVESAASPSFSRAFELLNKTNQFNTSGRRWSLPELLAFLREGGAAHTVQVRDRFAEYGLVGVVLTRGSDSTQFVKSCRVLGMDVELAVVSTLAAGLFDASPSQDITGTIVETESNMPCRDLYLRCGFSKSPETDGHRYTLRSLHSVAKVPHIMVN